MRTITPFQQLVTAEIERLRSVVTARVPVPQTIGGFAAFSNRYTIQRIQSRTKASKGLLARVFGN